MRTNAHLGRQGGWTLIELLVVIGVISVLVALSSQGVGGSAKNVDITTARGVISGAFREAGLAARTLNRPARVLISADSSDAQRYLRYVGVEVEEIDENGQARWTPVSKGTALPQGIRVFDEYLNLDYSPGATPVSTVQSSYPHDAGTQKTWLCFNVNSRGIFEQAGRVLVVGPSDGADAAANVAKRKGVVVLKSGVPLTLDAPPQL